MGINLRLFFNAFKEIIASKKSDELKVIAFTTIINDAYKYAEECGQLE